jgi:hypothetical protein
MIVWTPGRWRGWRASIPRLLAPVKHRSRQAQADLMVIRARASLVRARTALVNAARGLTKSYGERIRGCNPRNLDTEKAQTLSPELQAALAPLLHALESLSQRIKEYNQQIEEIAQQSYPQTALLKQVKGVGTLIALTYMLTLEDPHRFRKSRDAGCYAGLQPARRNSGQREPQMHNQQRGRSLPANHAGAGGASHPGTVRGRQRSTTMGFAAGGTRRQERQEASCHRDGAQAGGAAASLVGEWRSLRATAQQQSDDVGDSLVAV